MKAKFWLAVALTAGTILSGAVAADAETLRGALAKAYHNNQSLNAARAEQRATDEAVPQAKSGLRPFISAVGRANANHTLTTHSQYGSSDYNSRSLGYGFGVQLNQALFDGFQTPNNVRAAKARVLAGQENLANSVQNTFTDTVSAYMDVVRDREIASLRRQNLSFLEEQVRAARARLDVGEGTRTDVAQAEAERALATATLNSALAQVASSEATYFQVVGAAPTGLSAAEALTGVLPPSIDAALSISQRDHPAILATLHLVDAASFQVKSAEGALLPQVSLTGEVEDSYSTTHTNDLPGVGSRSTGSNALSATVGATLTIPIYQGGLASSQVRQYKETLGQRRIEVDSARDQVRAAVATAWATLEAARANVSGYRSQVEAAKLALQGVSEERNVGQRTTLDVLNSQADVITAQILLAGARRDVVVGSYALASAIGHLTPQRLKLPVAIYDPNDHYKAVEDKWGGLRTPDGR
ncbi:TolC family outer membrane protein [Consotaella salsifontis]|uniref:Outer membrane protein n=1 Tax=Consotaella salsifontis TaxID=1365950 RepID=A0A1T4RB03_9HYPH|nr:outer membrane protein [Consotaella salsifontis]